MGVVIGSLPFAGLPRRCGEHWRGLLVLGAVRPTHSLYHRSILLWYSCDAARYERARADTLTPVTKREKTVSTSIRLKPSLKAQLERIARAERRPTNNWIVITLEDAVARYLAEHPEVAQSDERRRPS